MFVTRTPLMFTCVIGLTQLSRPTRRFVPSHRGAVCTSSRPEVTGAAGGLLVADPPHPASSSTPSSSARNLMRSAFPFGVH